MYHLVLSTINSNVVFVLIIAQTAPFFFQLSYCVTDMELISPMGFLAPFAPDALIVVAQPNCILIVILLLSV